MNRRRFLKLSAMGVLGLSVVKFNEPVAIHPGDKVAIRSFLYDLSLGVGEVYCIIHTPDSNRWTWRTSYEIKDITWNKKHPVARRIEANGFTTWSAKSSMLTKV